MADRRNPPPIADPLPARIDAVLADQLYVPRAGLPPGLVNRLVRLAAFQNPEFYRAQAMRRSTFGISRVVACAELLSHHIALPRGCIEAWIAQLGAFVDLPASGIGQIGGGKRKPGGVVDVATIQSLHRDGEVDDTVADYGHLVVDECHHLSAVTFEAVARRARAKYILGLSATVTRKDGQHPIVFMQCGPVRFRASAKSQARRRGFRHRAILRPTRFRLPVGTESERPPIQQIYAALAEDEARNSLIFDDVLNALESARSPLVLTERKDHARRLADRLERFARNVILLVGGMGARQRREIMERLDKIPDTDERVLVATGRYVGEGFDDARLDTLFLTMPVSWKGTLAQYVGRLHRLHPRKREVLVYDYLDETVPALDRMGRRRVKGYENLGYAVERPDSDAVSEIDFRLEPQ